MGREFISFANQVWTVIDSLHQLAARHPHEVDAQRIGESLRQFGDSILTVDAPTGLNERFGSQAGQIYSTGKALLDRIGSAMADERLPLPTRLKALQSLADDVNVCADGALLQLSQCLQSIDRRHGGLMNSALSISNALMQEAMLTVIRRVNDLPHDEIHFLTGVQQVIFPKLGREPPNDSLAKQPAPSLVKACQKALDGIHLPSNLALALADRARSSLEDSLSTRLNLPVGRLHQHFEFDQAAREALEFCREALVPDYGELPLDVLIDWREAGDQTVARLHNDSMMLGLHLLRGLENLGVVQEACEASIGIPLAPLAPSVRPYDTAKLLILDGRLIWVEQQGRPRAICIDDLRALPNQDTPPGSAWPQGINRPSSGLRPLLTQIAIQNAWPDEFTDGSSSLLLDAALAGPLIRGMDDVSLQAWLRREGPRLTPIQHHWLQEELVTQDRSDLLSLAALREWSLRSLEATSPALWHLAISVGSESILRNVGLALIQVSRNARTQDHVPSPDETGPGTPSVAWLCRCFTNDDNGADPLFSRLLHERPALGAAALEIMLKAVEEGLLSRQELLSLVTGCREGDATTLAIRLSERPSAESLTYYLDLLDVIHSRISLTSEELVACFCGRMDGRVCGAAVAFSNLDGDGPMLLMRKLSSWLQQKRLQPAHWMDLMIIPTPPTVVVAPTDVAAPHNMLALRMTIVEPKALQLYLTIAADNFKAGLIDGDEIRALLLARGNDVRDVPTLPSYLTSNWNFPGADLAPATRRLQLFMDTLLELSRHGRFTSLDLLDLLAEPKTLLHRPWGEIRTMAPHDGRRNAVEAGFASLIRSGALTEQQAELLLQDEDPRHHVPDTAPAQQPARPT
ncbi:hypothetical protein [Roseateles sp. YR242]|uniref:hypothetical protein n=1 Tax=Roseateles sp. YR242 TaxID=1855305 RepID=UPI000B854B37|nr:hypothetical protein [Roseateles sp. YR242]